MVATLAFFFFAAQDFATAKACAACHLEIATTQATTHHAKALSLAPDNRWAFGAGAQAITYVSQTSQDTYLEHGLSWYKKTGALSLTPGHRDAAGVTYFTFAPDASILRCFQCHSTGKLQLSPQRAITPSEQGVRCEACHGPGAEHAAKPAAANIINPRRMTASQLNDHCGQCHRMPPAAGVATNFDNPWNVRHQPVYLSQSACFLKSQGKLSCLTCHKPHEDANPENTKTFTDTQCASCHASPKHQTVVGTNSCVSCHMPTVKPSPQLGFANHWIGIYRLTGPTANLQRPLQQRPRR